MTQLEQMEAHVNGLAGTLVRECFANGGSVLEVNDQARIAWASAGRKGCRPTRSPCTGGPMQITWQVMRRPEGGRRIAA